MVLTISVLEYSGLDNFLPNREVIRAWISHMFTVQKLKPSTVNIRLRTVKAMSNWAVKERILRESPFENVDLMRVPEEEFQVISPAQERRLFEACDLTTLVGLRDALLMSVLLITETPKAGQAPLSDSCPCEAGIFYSSGS